jgi:acylphosphatase
MSRAKILMIKKVIIKGIVQGVGCRGYCARYARKYLIKGSATNMNDGSVKLILSYQDENLFKQYIISLLTNPDRYTFFGHIDDISINDYSGKTDGDYNF